MKFTKLLIAACIVVSSSACIAKSNVSATISVSPMFQNIVLGGTGFFVISNKTSKPQDVVFSVKDSLGLNSERCIISSLKERIKPMSSTRVRVKCKKNKIKGMDYVEVMSSSYRKMELRRVILY